MRSQRCSVLPRPTDRSVTRAQGRMRAYLRSWSDEYYRKTSLPLSQHKGRSSVSISQKSRIFAQVDSSWWNLMMETLLGGWVTDGTDNILMVSWWGRRSSSQKQTSVWWDELQPESVASSCWYWLSHRRMCRRQGSEVCIHCRRKWYGKDLCPEEYREQGRGGSGVKVGATNREDRTRHRSIHAHRRTEKEGSVIPHFERWTNSPSPSLRIFASRVVRPQWVILRSSKIQKMPSPATVVDKRRRGREVRRWRAEGGIKCIKQEK